MTLGMTAPAAEQPVFQQLPAAGLQQHPPSNGLQQVAGTTTMLGAREKEKSAPNGSGPSTSAKRHSYTGGQEGSDMAQFSAAMAAQVAAALAPADQALAPGAGGRSVSFAMPKVVVVS